MIILSFEQFSVPLASNCNLLLRMVISSRKKYQLHSFRWCVTMFHTKYQIFRKSKGAFTTSKNVNTFLYSLGRERDHLGKLISMFLCLTIKKFLCICASMRRAFLSFLYISPRRIYYLHNSYVTGRLFLLQFCFTIYSFIYNASFYFSIMTKNKMYSIDTF